MEYIAKQLKELRESRHLSQAGLGIALGVSRGTISNWELGRRKMLMVDAVRVAQYFHITIEALANPHFKIEDNNISLT